MDIVIHYNSECGFEEVALMLARRLFAEFDEQIDSLALIPVAEEEFDLWLNGCLVHSLSQSGQPPRVADMLRVAEIDELDGESGT
ncbi:MAG: Rdx family protein [Thermomicrobiales bacterium]